MFLAYVCSGGAWIFGFGLFIPYSWINIIYHLVYALYGLQVWLLQERMTGEAWLVYPLRRLCTQIIIQATANSVIGLPGIGISLMPLLGVWAVSDYLDYAGWDSIVWTMGIPFNS